MVVRSLFTGVSGLQAHQEKMDVVSNNITNVNTPGFKKSNAVFSSFLSQQLQGATAPGENRGGTNPNSVGLGVQVGSINNDMSQGQLERTGGNTDLAIEGDGFFQVRENGADTINYTRAGSFNLDADGNMVKTGSGDVVQGITAEVEDGEIQPLADGQSEDIQITEDMQSIPGQATTFQEMAGNLDADAETGIDSITNEFNNSEIRYDFERYHPDENMYRFEAKWAENPPAGKQVGSAVTDQITGRPMEGIMELDENNNVVNVFRNPSSPSNDSMTYNGTGRFEADPVNPDSSQYQINEEVMFAGDRNNFMDAEDGPENFRMNFNQGAGDFDIEFQDQEGNWNTFEAGAFSVADINGGNRYVSSRTDADGDNREGELIIDDLSQFFGGTTNFTGDVNPADGDQIYFEVHQGSDTEGILEKGGLETQQEFLWGGPDGGSLSVSRPNNTSSTDGELQQFSIHDEAAFTGAVNTVSGANTNVNDITNRELRLNFDNGNTGPGGNAGGNYDLEWNNSGTWDDSLSPAGGIDITDDFVSNGITISAEDFQGQPTDFESGGAGIQIEMTATDSRSPSDEAYSIVRDGSGDRTAMFAPAPGDSMSFNPNLTQTAGILGDFQANSGSGETASRQDDEQIQTGTSANVFDSQGEEHNVRYTFEKKDTNEWMYHAIDPAPTNPDDPDIAGFGRINFNENGQIDQVENFQSKVAQNRPEPGPDGNVDTNGIFFDPPENQLQPPNEGANPVDIQPSFDGITQFAGSSDLSINDQDGNAQGDLNGIEFDQAGVLNGSYDNGESRQLAQLRLATFRNPEGLSKEGGTMFAETNNSGTAQEADPGTGGVGGVVPGALEGSNADLSAEFTTMITTQQGYQASSRTISTSDQMIQDLLQLR